MMKTPRTIILSSLTYIWNGGTDKQIAGPRSLTYSKLKIGAKIEDDNQIS